MHGLIPLRLSGALFVSCFMAIALSFAAESNEARTRYEENVQGKTRTAPRIIAMQDAIAIDAPVIINSGFETGNFSGWVAGDNGLAALEPWNICSEFQCGYFFNNSPIEGVFDAVNGFDGEAGYEAFLYQDVQVPEEGATLSWWDRIQYDGLGIPSELPRIYEVQIRDLNDNVLKVVHHQEVFLYGTPYTDLGWQNRIVDISDFTDRVVRVYLSLFVPEDFTGPAQFEVDNFQLIAAEPKLDHYVCYKITPAKRNEGLDRQVVIIKNQLEEGTYIIRRPDSLCVPSSKEIVDE